MTTRRDTDQIKNVIIHARCTSAEKLMLKKICAHEGRTETSQILYWIRREHSKLFGEER